MLDRIWQWLKKLFQRLGTSPQPSSQRRGAGNPTSRFSKVAGGEGQPPPTLTDTDYEFLFTQLLEGVYHGWQQARVLKFFRDLEHRTSETEWVAWLRRFAERLLASPTPNNELAARMVQLGELECGEISDVAYEIGMQLLTRDREPVWEYDGLDAEPVFLADRSEMEDQQPVRAVTLDELVLMLRQDPNLVKQVAQTLGIETTDPEAIIELVTNQFNSTSQLNLDDPEVWFNLGIEQFNAGDLEGAIASWTQAIEINPDKHEAWHNRGVALSRLGRDEEANVSFEKAREIRGE